MQVEGVKEIGIGAALMITLMIIKEVVSSLLKRGEKQKASSDEESAGAKNVEFWQREYDKSAEKIINEITVHAAKIEDRLMKRLDDVYAALQTLIRWKGGD